MPDENVIGLRAELDIKDFVANEQQMAAALAHVNSIIENTINKQKNMAAQAATTEEQNAARLLASINAQVNARKKGAADIIKTEQDAARVLNDINKKEAGRQEKISEAETKARYKAEAALRKFAIASAVVAATVVTAYKAMRDAAKELGDTEAIAQFDAMDASLKALKDTVQETGLEFLKASDAIPFITSGLVALNQVVILSAAGLIGFLEIIKGVFGAGEKFKNYPGLRGKAEPIDTQGIMTRAQEAMRGFISGTINVPQSREQVKLLEDQEKEANKQRAKTAENIHDYNEKILELQTKSGESILEAEKDFHDKSAEAWQSYIDKVESITADGIRERAKLAQDYSDKIASAELDYQRGVEDASYNHGKKLADIERDYQNTIRNIQQTYQEDALDAIRNLDAIGFIRAKEKRDKDLANARVSRDEANAAEGENYTRQLYELQRALEDKRREAELAYQRGLEDQRIAEQTALQDAKNSYNQQNADTRKALDDKLATINQSYANENAAAAAQYGYSESALRAHLQEMQNIMSQYGIGGVTPPTSPRVRRRAEGGLDIVSSPTQFVAGEAGPEMVYTAPLSRAVPVAVPQVVNHVGDFQHSIDSTIRSSVAGLDGRITAVVRKAIAEVIR